MLSPQKKNRYKRQINLPLFGEEAQIKLKKASALVVGAGGLGAPVLNYLTAAGVGTIGIVDADIVDESNLQRQVLFNSGQIGEKKVYIAQQQLSALNLNVVFIFAELIFNVPGNITAPVSVFKVPGNVNGFHNYCLFISFS